MVLTFLIGAGEFPLEEADARWLEKIIRKACTDAAGRPWDPEARAVLQVADMIRDDLMRSHSPEPIALGWASALGLLHSFHEDVADVDAHVARSNGIAALYLALRRFARDGA